MINTGYLSNAENICSQEMCVIVYIDLQSWQKKFYGHFNVHYSIRTPSFSDNFDIGFERFHQINLKAINIEWKGGNR